MSRSCVYLSRERLAEYLLQQYRIPQTYHNLLLADLRKVKPEALVHVSQEMTKIKLPREMHVPTLIAVGQEEAFVIKQDAYEMRRALHCARGVLVPGVGHFWNLVAPDCSQRRYEPGYKMSHYLPTWHR